MDDFITVLKDPVITVNPEKYNKNSKPEKNGENFSDYFKSVSDTQNTEVSAEQNKTQEINNSKVNEKNNNDNDQNNLKEVKQTNKKNQEIKTEDGSEDKKLLSEVINNFFGNIKEILQGKKVIDKNSFSIEINNKKIIISKKDVEKLENIINKISGKIEALTELLGKDDVSSDALLKEMFSDISSKINKVNAVLEKYKTGIKIQLKGNSDNLKNAYFKIENLFSDKKIIIPVSESLYSDVNVSKEFSNLKDFESIKDLFSGVKAEKEEIKIKSTDIKKLFSETKDKAGKFFTKDVNSESMKIFFPESKKANNFSDTHKILKKIVSNEENEKSKSDLKTISPVNYMISSKKNEDENKNDNIKESSEYKLNDNFKNYYGNAEFIRTSKNENVKDNIKNTEKELKNQIKGISSENTQNIKNINGTVASDIKNLNTQSKTVLNNQNVQNVPAKDFREFIQQRVNNRITENFFNETMKIKVNPPEMGEVNIQIMKSGNSVTINITTDSDANKFLLSKNLQGLVGNLRDSGFNPVEINVETKSEQDLFAGQKNNGNENKNNENFYEENTENEENNFEEILRGEENA